MANFFEQFHQPETPPQQSQGNFFAQFHQAPVQNEPAPTAGMSRFDEPMGKFEAVIKGAQAGQNLNFDDEMEGLLRASGIPKFADPAVKATLIGKALGMNVGGVRMLYEYFTGGKGPATEAYQAGTEEVRAGKERAQQEQPGAYLGGELVGSLTAPAGAVRGATWGGRALSGAATGAVTGAVSGAGEGEGLADRGTRAVIGGGLGAGIGAVAPPAIELAGKAVGMVAGKPISYLRSGVNPQGAAERAVAGAYGEAARADPTGAQRMLPSELTPGGPAMAIDVLGQPGRVLGRDAANLSGEAHDVLTQALGPRATDQNARVNTWARETFHYPDPDAQQQAILKAAGEANPVAYRKAAMEAQQLHPGGLWDDSFKQIKDAPEVQAAIRKALVTGASRVPPREGMAPIGTPFRMDRATGQLTVPEGGPGPSLPFWDEVKKNLDKVGTRDAQDWSRVLRQHIDELVPSYGEARAGAAHFFGARDALTAGKDYVTKKMPDGEARRALASMSETERQLFKDGFAGQLIETVRQIPNRRDLTKALFNNDAARTRMEIALGKDGAREFEALMRSESLMQQALEGIKGNSTTAMQLLAAGAAGGAGGYGSYDSPTAGAIAGMLLAGGKSHVDKQVATRIAQLLTSKDPAVFARGIKGIARSEAGMNALRALEGGTVRTGAAQAGG